MRPKGPIYRQNSQVLSYQVRAAIVVPQPVRHCWCGKSDAVLGCGKRGAALPHGRMPAAAPERATRVLKVLYANAMEHLCTHV